MFTLSPDWVHETVKFKKGAVALKLTVDADSFRMVTALRQAQQELSGLTDEATEEAQQAAALHFAAAIFGDEQARALLHFYHDDVACVINVCGQYFSKRLKKKIIRAQKKTK